MKKNLKICIDQPIADEPLCLVDMNEYERIEQSGMKLDLVHKRSAHISGAWSFAEKERVSIAMHDANLTAYRYLTFAVFAVNGAGGSFSLFFDSSENGDRSSGYECTLSIAHDGWNEYRIELPFMRAWRTPRGWDHINSIDLDCVFGGQSNRMKTVLYFDTLFVWKEMAPPLYATMPELKGAAAFTKGGGFAIVNRKRIALSIDGSDVRPFEEKGQWWIPMGAIAAVMAHSAVADNKACTLTFTYRRKKYAFEARSAMMQVDGVRQTLTFAPIAREGILFFPSEFVRDFFHWRQIFTDPMGMIVFSNRKNIFDNTRDADRVRSLIFDMTFLRPTGEQIVSDLRKKIKNPTRGRVLATYDELMQLRKLAKTDADLKALVLSIKQTWSEVPVSIFDEEENQLLAGALIASVKKLMAWSMLYRVTGDKQYCERVEQEAERVAGLADWGGSSLTTVATVAFGMSLAYDWCHHMWSEARKAVIERAILRNALRPAVEAYQGNRNMWDTGSANGALINAGFLAAALAMADLYPETTLKILNCVLRNAEPVMGAFAPDGGYAEGVAAWETGFTNAALIVRMLQTACGDDYGLLHAPGFMASAYFAMHAETENGAWNYHNSDARAIDTSILSYFTKVTQNPIFAWLRRRELISERKAVTPFDILFYTAIDVSQTYEMPLDAVYRKAGLAMMRSDWSGEEMIACLHGGKNNERDGDLDAGGFILECAGERFFCETGGNEAIPMLLRRRAEGQNTIVIDPTEDAVPDQNPGAVAPIVEMRSSDDRVYAVVDMSATNDKIVRAKRGIMLTEKRSVAVIQDEVVLAGSGVAVWNAYTAADVALNKSGRVAKLIIGEKALICKLCGVGSPARFEAKVVADSGLTHLSVCIEGKDRLRMAVVCYLAKKDEKSFAHPYDMTPISKWNDIK